MSLDLRFNLTLSTPSTNELFQSYHDWYWQAKKSGEELAEAGYLATVNEKSQASVRAVLFKGFNEVGPYFFTDFTSAKSSDIAVNSQVSVVWHWKSHERQIRMSGAAHKLSQSVIDEYYYSRPIGSQIAARLSHQSSEIEDYDTLRQAYLAELEPMKKAMDNGAQAKELHQRPARWGGYQIVVDSGELWQGQPDRVHIRKSFYRENEQWKSKLLSP